MAHGKKDLIVILHPIHAEIPREKVEALVSPEWRIRDIVEVRPAKFSLADSASQDFFGLAREQERIWRTALGPVLSEYSNAAIGYFGLAPIPLIFHLGSLVERFREVVVFHAHHETHEWLQDVSGPASVLAASLGESESLSEDPVAITISVTRTVDRTGFLNAVGTVRTVLDLYVDPCAEDRVGQAEATKIAREFSRMLQWLEEKRPRSKELHIGAAVPCGVAFALGAQVTRTRHGQIILYQYAKPRHRDVLRLPLPSRLAARPATREEIEMGHTLRKEWELARQEALNQVPNAGDTPWYAILGKAGDALAHGRWRPLQTLHQTPFVKQVSNLGDDEPEFRLDRQHGWVLGVGLLSAMARRLKGTDLVNAGRMLLLHEALHHGAQRLTSGNARLMRLHPRVLEEVDYLADVWAVLHEFVFQCGLDAEWPAQRDLLCRLISTALETMWAFDETQVRGVLEVRRVSRYLLWYLNWAQLEKAVDWASALQILSEKPIVDLVGPEVRLEEGRLVMRLDGRPNELPELGILKNSGEVKRIGATPGFKPEELAQALGEHDGARIKQLVSILVDIW